MKTEYYSREVRAVLNTLVEASHEMRIMDLLEQAHVSLFVAPTVISRLLEDKKIAFRMENNQQYFYAIKSGKRQ